MQPSVVEDLVPAFGEYLIAARELQWCMDDWHMPSIVRFYVVRAVCATIGSRWTDWLSPRLIPWTIFMAENSREDAMRINLLNASCTYV